jgi:heme-degrading monooxygenase HmoA
LVFLRTCKIFRYENLIISNLKSKIIKMFVRIVKMSFHEDRISDFLENFETVKDKIRKANGNRFLELYQDKNDKCIFFTYSYWETEADLENYRQSELFNSVWSFTKQLFNAKPEAWSVDKLVSLE